MFRRLALQLALAIVLAGPGLAERAQWLGSFAWSLDVPWFGGFSGIELSEDGRALTVISDRARLVVGTITRQDKQISQVEITQSWPLRAASGQPLTGRIVDSEGLAIGRDGTLFVSFEGVARVSRYDRPGGRAVPLPRAPLFRTFAKNGSLEALAIDSAGRLYTLPEEIAKHSRIIPVLRWDSKQWRRVFDLPARGDFLPVGADFGPDGRFYLLERAFGALGFRSRVRRWTFTPDGPDQETTVLTTGPTRHGNLEGIAVWRAPDGLIRLTMVTDDNFLDLQRNELVEYEITE
ncbi:MAG: esterase-like activity of phytase family protein [Sedimentitalea sp.]